MIVDLEREPNLPVFPADVCIVGAGAAGIVLAAELVRQGKRVMLLESGGLTLESAAQALNECFYAGQPHRGANIGRFRALGGTTTAWGGQILELDEEDFASRSWIPGSGWPFPKEVLAPYYERALAAEGLAHVCRSDRKIWQQMKVNAPELCEALEPYFTRWCPEPNFARLYRKTFNSPNLCMVLHATATAILLDEIGSRMRGIQGKTPAGREHTFSAAQYVLCLGTIESVRFLLQPLPCEPTPSWNRCGLLGHHFQSHIDFNAARVPANDAAKIHRWFANAYLHGHKYHPKFRLAFPLRQREKILNIAGSITCINSAEPELRRIKSLARNFVRRRASVASWDDIPSALRQLPVMLRLWYGYRVRSRAAWPKNSTFWLRTHCEQEPLSQSRITLTDERDSAGLFRARLDWRVSPLEWKTIRYFTDQVKRIFAAQGLAHIVPQPELALEEGFRNVTFDDSHHHMGGTRMALSDVDGVVDPDLRLHGVDNAYVCSASVFPTSGFSNPTHTLIALAIRLADHLMGKSDLSSRPDPERSEGEVEGPAFSNPACAVRKDNPHA
jgi:choline dehydrogenase-like flavoprotein